MGAGLTWNMHILADMGLWLIFIYGKKNERNYPVG
jgi:hypothetical protein